MAQEQQREEFLIRDKDTGQARPYYVSAENINLGDDETYKSLPTKLAEMQDEIDQAGSGDGTVTGVKVGNTPYDPDGQGVVDLSTPFAGKVDKETGKSLMTDAERTKLQNLPTADQLTSQLSSKANDADVVKSVTINGQTPQLNNGNVSFNVQGGGESVVINSDGANIVDSHTNPSILVAPSARQMYMAYNNIATLFRKVNDLYDKLAGIAFTDGKPESWKEYADWSTPAIPTHTITLGTMSNVSASINGTAINGSTSTSEGEVTIKLTPAQGAMILTENISIKLGMEDVPFTTAADNGSTLVTFILAGDVTVAASASSGRNIIFTGSTGCSIGAADVAIGQDLDATITANEHFTLPASITVKIGNANVTHTYTRAQDNKTATLHIDAANITGDLTITCTAVEDAHVTLAIIGSNFVVNQGNTQLSNGSKVYNGSAAQTLTIEPASGYKFSTLPSADKGTMTNNGPYAASSLEIGTSVSGTLTITATATGLAQNLSVTQPSDANITTAIKDGNGNTLTSGSIVEGTEVNIVMTPGASYSITIGSVTMGQSTLVEDEDFTVSDNNGVLTINIPRITGSIVVVASAALPGTMQITKSTTNGSITSDNTPAAGENYVANIESEDGYGLRSSNIVVKINGVATNNFTLAETRVNSTSSNIEHVKYTGVLTVPTSADTESVDISIVCPLAIHTGYYWSTNVLYQQANSNCCASAAAIKLNAAATPSGKIVVKHLIPANTAGGAGYPAVKGCIDGVFKADAYFSLAMATGNPNRVKTITGSSDMGYFNGVNGLECTFKTSDITSCYIDFWTDASDDSTKTRVFDGSDETSYMLIAPAS